MQTLQQAWEDMCGLIVRPQRCEYDITSLGPQLFRIDDGIYERTDVTVYNPRGMELKCSHFEPVGSQRPKDKMPCVVYLHGNCGSRQDSLDCVTVLLPHGITLFSFDFSGSGMSDGDYVSLGYYEKQDLATVIDYLHTSSRVSRIGLWGRSMGAVTSIMYASKDPAIGGIVCDSPFSSLPDLMQELVLSQKPWVPKFLLKAAINTMRNSIVKKVGFDINDLNTKEYASRSDVPALLAHAKDDLLVDQEHSKIVQQAYQGECALMGFEGGHNSDRPEFFLDAVTTFFIHHLITKPGPAITKTQSESNNKQSHVDPTLVLKGEEEVEEDEKREVIIEEEKTESQKEEIPNPKEEKEDEGEQEEGVGGRESVETEDVEKEIIAQKEEAS